jgi:hypothetical protein
MFYPNATIATLYVSAPAAVATRWLAEGIPAATDGPDSHHGTVDAWLQPDPRRAAAGTQWLAASIAPAQVIIADWDLAQGAASAPDEEATRRLLATYDRTLTPWHEYRLGQFRRPLALVQGGLAPENLVRVTSLEDGIDHETVYAQQVIRALRAMIGAPLDTPLQALVAAAVGRGRAKLVATYRDIHPVHLYFVDNDSWYFTLDTAFNALTALPYADSPRIKG